MIFGEKLRRIMDENRLTQRNVCELTGVGASSISQYLSGEHEPTRQRKRDMAVALGVSETYFDEFLTSTESVVAEASITVADAARRVKKSAEWVKQGLIDGVFPWGYAVKLRDWSFWISAAKFGECTAGVNLPITLAAKFMKKSPEWVEKGLQDRVFPWGYAVKLSRWGYFISSANFEKYTGIEVMVNDIEKP